MELNQEFEAPDLELATSLDRPTRVARCGIIVVGSHRSGTSALTRVLNLLGCDLPKRLMPPLKGNNALGFWEPEMVVQAHETFLEAIGSSWDDIAALPERAFLSTAAAELRQQLAMLVQEEYATSPLFVVKDPRISRLLPLWFAVLAELQIAPVTALAVRNPLEVAASLKARDAFTSTKSLLLWLRYTLESERHSRSRPRSIVMYDQLLCDWQGVLAIVERDLGLKWPGRSQRATAAIENFLSAQHRHHVFDWRDVEGRADVVSWVKEAYFALRASEPVTVLDQVQDELSKADAAFGPIFEEAQLTLRSSHEQMLHAAAARDALAADLESQETTLRARTAEVQQLQEEVARLRGVAAESEEQAAGLEAQVVTLRGDRDDLANEVSRSNANASRLAAAVEAADRRLAFTDTNASRRQRELTAALAEVERLRTEAGISTSRIEALEASANAERKALLRSLDAARTTAVQLETEVATSTATFVAREAQHSEERARLVEQLEAAHGQVEELAARLQEESLAAEELGRAADELLSAAAVELEESRADQDRLRAEVANSLAEQSETLILAERLERDLELATNEVAILKSEAAEERAEFLVELEAARAEGERLASELDAAHSHAEWLAATTMQLDTKFDEQGRLLRALQSATKRRTLRRRSLAQLGTWLLPPTPRKLNYLRRYLSHRWSKRFDVDWYLLTNPDVVVAGVDPLMHFVEYGTAEGRRGAPDPSTSYDPTEASLVQVDNDVPRFEAIEITGTDDASLSIHEPPEVDPIVYHEFDPVFYRQSYSDISGTDAELLQHYLTFGWREHRDPCPSFSTAYYLERNRDIRDGDINPFVHFLMHGREEGRLPRPYKETTLSRRCELTISAIVPAFNHASFLLQRIESIVAQDRPPDEIVFLDDASTDGTRELIEAVGREIDIPVVTQFNDHNSGNVFKQWQKGLALATGDLVWICESDDFCSETFLSSLVTYFADPSVTLGFGRIQLADEHGIPGTWLDHYRESAAPGYWDVPRVESAYTWFNGPFGRLNVIPNVGGCLFRRPALPTRVWRDAQRYSVCGDWFLYMHIAGGGRIAYEPGAVSYFRQHGSNTSVSGFTKPAYYREHAWIGSALRHRYGVDDSRLCELYRRVRDQHQHHFPESRRHNFNRLFNLQDLIDQEQETRHVLIGILGFKTGGAELFPINLANALAARGYAVSVLVLDTTDHEPAVRARLRPDIPVYERGLVQEIGLARFFEDHGIDLVHTHYLGVDRWIHRACKDAGIPYVVTLHGSYEVDDLDLETKASLLETVTQWVYVADKNLDVFDSLPIDHAVFTKVPNAVPEVEPDLRLPRADFGIPEDAFVFGIASRAIKAKGWDIAAEATARVDSASRPVYLALCGDGEDYDELTETYGDWPGVVFLGHQPNAIAFYRMCDCCLLPTRFRGESFPLTLIEALSAGTPIIATDSGEIRGMIAPGDSAAGIVLPPLDNDDAFVVAVAAAMSRMLTEHPDFARGAERQAKKYSFKRLLNEYEAIYNAAAKWPVGTSGTTR